MIALDFWMQLDAAVAQLVAVYIEKQSFVKICSFTDPASIMNTWPIFKMETSEILFNQVDYWKNYSFCHMRGIPCFKKCSFRTVGIRTNNLLLCHRKPPCVPLKLWWCWKWLTGSLKFNFNLKFFWASTLRYELCRWVDTSSHLVSCSQLVMSGFIFLPPCNFKHVP